ncbi:hypothetical protein DYU05_16100 [Mucilaginibacter terrenus]|uniref:Lipoprotein n=1 Tax=Mucilaginibacter terrenus TaxID=2482727 RepID=A0A3E2NME6_9SPHI|nr:hypothetical protein [Mucilaginibacter terrenus]RFZ82142.1 hypothetical protein DYU05_16100 [Mucilaginibacter terrenus]
MALKKHIIIVLVMLLCQVSYSCRPHPRPEEKLLQTKAVSNGAKEPAMNNEKMFRVSLRRFKQAVKTHNKQELKLLFNFPLQTSPQWTNDEVLNSNVNPKTGLLTESEFLSFFNDIFTADVLRLIPVSDESDLLKIDKLTDENYYKQLMKVADENSTLFELNKQYTQDNGQETSFGFVFGKVNGSYKVISYYRPWPLKD